MGYSDKNTNSTKLFEAEIRNKIEPFTDVPILFISALNKQRIFQAIELAEKVHENRKRKIKTSELNTVFLELIEKTPPPRMKDRQPKIKYVTMLKTYYPTFVFFSNFPQYIKEPYKRFLENQIRKMYDFSGVPIEIYFRKK
jgi:GTP-binding protein